MYPSTTIYWLIRNGSEGFAYQKWLIEQIKGFASSLGNNRFLPQRRKGDLLWFPKGDDRIKFFSWNLTEEAK